MAIIDSKTIESSDGIEKEIDEKSKSIVFDILQRGIYAYPIKSTIRELVSNAHDAIIERNISRDIILGKEKLGDHYDLDIKAEGIYHSSGWDKDYYDLKWLSDDPVVYVKYIEREGRDLLSVSDFGVGLGGKRLFNYFTLNYSSKRTNKDTLGRFGLGSKVALSLGVDSFRVKSNYNGMQFIFDVYLDKIESIVPKFAKDGSINEFILLKDKYKAYWEATTEKNGVEVSVDIKKHDKDRLFNAVSEQLMYIDGVKFLHKKLNDITFTEIPIAAEVLYNNGSIVISNNSTYNKPHILLGTGDALINYGPVQFKELELEERNGSVGLIMDINSLDVTPSREAPVWSSKTREAVISKYNDITEVASQYVSDSLKHENDYLKWVITINSIIHASVNGASSIDNKIIAAFASIISLNELRDVRFSPAPQLPLLRTYSPNKAELKFRKVKYNSYGKKIERAIIGSYSEMEGLPIYILRDGTVNRYTDRYIIEISKTPGFILLQLNVDEKDLSNPGRAILTSSLLQDYTDVVIPDEAVARYAADFSNDKDDDDADDTVILQAHHIDHEALRRQNQEIVVSVYNNGVFSSNDIKIAELSNFYNHDKVSIFHGTGTERDDMKEFGEIFPSYIIHNNRASISPNNKYGYSDSIHETDTVIPDRDLPSYYMLLLSQSNLPYIEALPKAQHVSQMIIEKFTKSTGILVFSEEISIVMTGVLAVKYIRNYIDNNFPEYKNSYSTMNRIILNTDSSDDLAKFINLYLGIYDKYEDHPLYARVTNHANKLIRAMKNNVGDWPVLKFLWDCLSIDLHGLYGDVSPVDEAEILDTINDEVPTSLTEYVGKIESVQLLNVKLFNEIVYYYSTIFANYYLWNTVDIERGYGSPEAGVVKKTLSKFNLTLIKDAIKEV